MPARTRREAGRRRLLLRTGCDEIRRGHPWVYRDAEVRALEARAGDVIDVHDARSGAFLAAGIFDDDSSLAIRLFSWTEGEVIGPDFFVRRLDEAVALRERFIDPAGTTAYRLLNGEGDGLPGLVIDRYGPFAVVQPYARLWLPHLAALAHHLRGRLDLRGVAMRSRVRRVDEAVLAAGLVETLSGEPVPDELLILEHGLRFLAHTRAGQKTGLFLDQKDNRLAVAGLSEGKRLLNAFSYTGGFSVYAARAGARATVSVDLSKACAVYARKNFELNGLLGPDHEFVAADVFEYLADPAVEPFDVVVLDPPSFATSKKQVFNARKGYEKLIAMACKKVVPRGILVACSCTAQIGEALFQEIVAGATRGAGRPMRLIEVRGLPADHPTAPGFPEGRYLKCLIGVL